MKPNIRNAHWWIYAAIGGGLIGWSLAMSVAVTVGDPTGVQRAGTLLIAGGILALLAGRSRLEEQLSVVSQYKDLRERFPMLAEPELLPDPFDDQARKTLRSFNDLFESGRLEISARRQRTVLEVVEIVMIVFGTLQTGYGDLVYSAIGEIL